MSELQFTLDGVDVTDNVVPSSLQVDDRLNGRKRCRFSMRDRSASLTLRPEIGESLLITYGTTTVFKGDVEDLTEGNPNLSTLNVFTINGSDVNRLADRFIVATTYEVEGQTLKDVVQNLVSTQADGLLATEGVTTVDYVQDGPVLGNIVFSYKTHAECFNELSEITGFQWWIDNDLKLHFIDPSTNIAPTSFSPSTNIRAMSIRSDRTKYRNRQWFRGGTARTSNRTETFSGDGERRNFELVFDVDNRPDEPPVVTVDAAAQTVGVRGADNEDDFDFLYARGDRGIGQSIKADKLTSSNLISVTYRGQYPFIVDERDEGEISARQDVESGTGQYHAVSAKDDIDTLELGIERAQGILRRYGFIPTILTIDTWEGAGVEPGQLVSVEYNQHGIDDDYVCTRVIVLESGVENKLQYRLILEKDERFEDWVDFFSALAKATQPKGIQENDQIILARSVKETVTITDEVVDPISVTPGDLVSGRSDPFSYIWFRTDITPLGGTSHSGETAIPSFYFGFARFGKHPNS